MTKFGEQINVISQCFVKPKYEVKASKQPYYLGPADLLFLHKEQIQKGLLFSTKPNNIQSEFLETLKESLAICLTKFYPLAGRFVTEELPDENAKWVYLESNKGSGGSIIHASVDYTVSDILLSVDVHPVVGILFDRGEKSINRDGHTRPLLTIQVTELVDGVFIGFAMNHSVVDGTSQWEFINSLSETFIELSKKQDNENSLISSKSPVFEPYFPEGWGPILKLPNKEVIKPLNGVKALDNGVMYRKRIFRFSSESIKKLKAKANEECEVHNTISSFQALTALMWRSITRARNLTPELETCIGLVMNARSRLIPPRSNEYFGNFIMSDQSICNVGDLLNKGIGWAAMFIHQLVVSQDENKAYEFYRGVAKFLCEGPDLTGKGKKFYSPNLVMIGGSARFDTYRPDFGLGKAEAVLAGYCNLEDGKVTANPGREGGGSVDLEVCLTPETMNALELDEEFMSFVTLN